MFDSHQKSTGTGYTHTIALMTVALIFSPGYIFAARPVGSLAIAVVLTCSAICLSLAWFTWKKSSQLSIPSLVKQEAPSK